MPRDRDTDDRRTATEQTRLFAPVLDRVRGEGDDVTRRVLWAILFAVLFMVAGSAIPGLYYQYADTDAFVNVETFVAQDTTTDADEIILLFTRTSQNQYAATVNVELNRVTDDYRVRVLSWERRVVYEQGRQTFRVSYPLEGTRLDPGRYQLTAVITLDLPSSTERTIELASNEFLVSRPADPPGTNASNASGNTSGTRFPTPTPLDPPTPPVRNVAVAPE